MSSNAYFDEVASQWDAMRKKFFSEAVREKAYHLAGVVAGTVAADVGCGTGFITEGLLSRGVKVIAVDQSRAMLEELTRKFPDALIECRQGEAAHLPIDDESVDYVFANMYLHHVEDPPRAIQEMARILKPGGRLVITDLDSHEFEFLRTEQHDRWMGFERAEVERWLRAAGLRNVKVECIDETCCASSTCGCSSASVSIFAAYGEK